MAKLELSIPYQLMKPQEGTALATFWTIFGLVAGWAIVTGGGLLTAALHGGVGLAIAASLFIAGGIGYVFIAYQVCTAQSIGANVLINQNGLGLPPSLWGLGSPRWLPWSEIKSIALRQSLADQSLVFNLNLGAAQLNLSRLSEQDLEQLLLVMEAAAPDIPWSSNLTEYRDDLQNKHSGLLGFSHTKIWDEELSRRFNSTNFVPLEPGAELAGGKLKIERQLAFGGFAAVYLARNHAGETVVVKELSLSSDKNEDSVRARAAKMFEREASMLATLNNPAICKIYDHFVEDGRNYLVLEYMPGQNLREVVRTKGALPADRVIALGVQMASVLAYLHGQSPPVVHRDFTPDNFVVQNDTLYLVDFGTANKFVGSATGTLVGKQCYMPPEQVKGKAEPASDVYAMGCSLAFLLTGTDPEPLASTRVDAAPPALSALIHDMTALDHEKRPGIIEVKRRLEAMMNGTHMLIDKSRQAQR